MGGLILCVLGGAIALIIMHIIEPSHTEVDPDFDEFMKLMFEAEVLPKITPRGGIQIDPKDVVASKGYRKYVHKPKENSNETM